ncbi:MAG: fumarate reductase subunit C [Planctomycetaceae bacterium]|nr:fumarate reductase subunit C [Planctomycetaceae bacterium]
MPRHQPATPAKQHIRPMPVGWWLKRTSYFLFMMRELTCVFVGGYALFLLMLVARIGEPDAFAALLEHPGSLVFHVLALPFVLYHTITWFNVTPKALVIYRGEEKVNPVIIAGANYVGWIVVSVALIWIAWIAIGSA